MLIHKNSHHKTRCHKHDCKRPSKALERMLAAGVDNKCEFAKAVTTMFARKWPTDKPVPWFDDVESKKKWWDGEFGHNIGQKCMFYLRLARNSFLTRVCATMGKYRQC